jgi:hypothetical protein
MWRVAGYATVYHFDANGLQVRIYSHGRSGLDQIELAQS